MTTVTDADIKEIKDAISSLSEKIVELTGEVKTTNAKIDGLDRRLNILETIYQRLFTVMLSFLGTGLAGIVLKFIWDNFKFVS